MTRTVPFTFQDEEYRTISSLFPEGTWRTGTPRLRGHRESYTINIASGKPVTIREVLSSILKASDYENAPVEYEPTKPTMIPKRMIDISLAKEKLGFQPKVSLEEGLKKTIKWYKEYYNGKSPEGL